MSDCMKRGACTYLYEITSSFTASSFCFYSSIDREFESDSLLELQAFVTSFVL